MSELDRPRLALYVALGLIVCVLGARYLHEQSAAPQQDGSPAAGAGASPGSASAAAAADGGGSGADGAGATVRIDRADGGRVTVHVAGAVRRPGVYRLAAGARVNDALRRAGGPRRGADLDVVNLAAKLEDGRQILVPLRATAGGGAAAAAGATTQADGAAAAAGEPAVPINLNTATLEQLETLDGVGPGIAQRILDYRAQHGGFRDVDELGEVPGIGEKRLAALRPKVTA